MKTTKVSFCTDVPSFFSESFVNDSKRKFSSETTHVWNEAENITYFSNWIWKLTLLMLLSLQLPGLLCVIQNGSNFHLEANSNKRTPSNFKMKNLFENLSVKGMNLKSNKIKKHMLFWLWVFLLSRLLLLIPIMIE